MTTYNVEIVVNGQDRASGPLSKVGSALGKIGEIAGGVMAANILQNIASGVVDLGKQALQSYASYERLGMALQSLSAREMLNSGVAGSMSEAMAAAKGQAAELQGWISKLAIQSPFSQDDVAQSFRLAMAYGFTTKEAQRLTQATIDFASGSGASGQSMQQIALALGQIKAKGQLAGQEMMQLTNAGLDVRSILAEAMGVTTEKLMKMTEKGLVPADKAIQAIVTSLEKDFGGAAKAQAGTFSGLIASLGDIKDIGLRELFTGTFQTIQPYVDAFVAKLSSPEFMAGLREIGSSIGNFIGIFARFPSLIEKFGASTAVVSTLQGLLSNLGIDVNSQPVRDFLETVRSGVDALPAKFDAFKQVLSEAMSSEPVQNLINSFSNLPAKFDAIKQGLSDAMKSEPVQNLINGFSGFVSFITTQWPPILKIIQDVGTVLMEALGPVVVAIFQGLSVAVGWLSEKFAQLGEWFSANGPLITEVLNIVGQDLIARWRLLGAAFQYIMQKATEMWAFIEPLLNGLVSFILGTVQAIMLAITGNWSAAWQALQIASAQLMIGIITAIIGFFDWIASFFGSSLTEISNIWSQNWSMFTQIVSTIWGNITSAISNGIAAVLSFLISKAVAFIEAGRAIMTAIINGIKNSVSNMTSAVSTFVGNILSTIGNTALKFAELGATLARNIVNGVTGAIGSVTDAVRNGISNALGGLGNIIGGFTSIGSDIIANIVSGITGAGSKVVDTLLALVKDAIDAIKKKLGIIPGGGAKQESANVLESAFTTNLNPALQTPSSGAASAGFGAGGSQSWSTSSSVANYFGPVTIANQSAGSPLELLQTMR